MHALALTLPYPSRSCYIYGLVTGATPLLCPRKVL